MVRKVRLVRVGRMVLVVMRRDVRRVENIWCLGRERRRIVNRGEGWCDSIAGCLCGHH